MYEAPGGLTPKSIKLGNKTLRAHMFKYLHPEKANTELHDLEKRFLTCKPIELH